MGIHGIYKEIGPGRRVALSKYSVEHYLQHSRPLRLAIDISIWIFQIQSGKGGSNPALRTFYYRLLRILSLNVHPLFVFDGPNKPPFKRNKRVGGPNVKVSSIPEFLAKQLLKQFGFPMHMAPGEAEAECALLQREGIVDAVLSEDVDTLMFGSGTTMRSWSAEAKSSKVPTHVNVYDATTTKAGSGLDREGMVLIALMSGGDYIPEGIPGCGPKTACEAARAGFGAELCQLKRKDDAGFRAWRERLRHELWTNESKLFKQRRRLEIPDDFPDREVLGYYTHPCVSGPEKLASLRQTLRWDMPIDFPSLRSFTADAFDWTCIGGAKKFIRNLAPAILTRELRMRAEQGGNDGDDMEVQASAEERLVKAIHGKRTHLSTDNMTEFRISFLPMQIIDIDLSQEPPDEEVRDQDSDSDAPVNDDVEIEPACPPSPRKRGPSKYNPEELEKIWMMDVFLRHGVPLKVQDYEASFRDHRQYLAAKAAAKEAGRKKKEKKKADRGMARGALDGFFRTTKPGVGSQAGEKSSSNIDQVNLTEAPSSSAPAAIQAAEPVEGFRLPQTRTVRCTERRPALDEVDLSGQNQIQVAVKKKTSKRPSPEPLSPAPHHRSKSETPKSNKYKQSTIIDLLSSPAAPIKKPDFGSQVQARYADEEDTPLVPLPPSVTKRRKRSPFKRHETAPAVLEEFVSPSFADTDLCGKADDSTAPKHRVEMQLPPVVSSPHHPNTGPSMSEALIRAGIAPKRSTPSARSASPTKRTAAAVETVDLSMLPDNVPPSRPQASGATDRHRPSMVVAAGTCSAATTSRPSAPAPAPAAVLKKKHYQLRESLEGGWKEVEADVEINMTGLVMPTTTTAAALAAGGFVRGGDSIPKKGKVFTAAAMNKKGREVVGGVEGRRWRKSEVEILDLTSG